MAVPALSGNIYKINLKDSKPSHYFVILNDPGVFDDRFIAVSFTDRHNFETIPDVWPTGYIVCGELTLAKPSVVALKYAVIRDQRWLNEYDAEFVGSCNQDSLDRARCNLIWYGERLKVPLQRFLRQFRGEWATPCGSAPQNPPKY